MTHTGDVKVDEAAALAAATVLATINSAINPDPQNWLPDARDAVTAYLRAMAERGERMMPRELPNSVQNFAERAASVCNLMGAKPSAAMFVSFWKTVHDELSAHSGSQP